MTPVAPDISYATVPDDAVIAAAVAGLRARGHHVQRLPDAAAARQTAVGLLPEGAEVFTASSMTAQAIGVIEDIDESGRYYATRPRLMAMDPGTQMSQMRRLAAAPQWVVGSVHAVTRDGDMVIASASGSQLASMVYCAQTCAVHRRRAKGRHRPRGRDAAHPRIQPAAGGCSRPVGLPRGERRPQGADRARGHRTGTRPRAARRSATRFLTSQRSKDTSP
jgi:LUD domain